MHWPELAGIWKTGIMRTDGDTRSKVKDGHRAERKHEERLKRSTRRRLRGH